MQIKIINQEKFNIQRETGVYLLKCVVNNRIYVGSTKQNFRARFSNHCKFLKQGNLQNKELQNDYNTYGSENFQFEILEITDEINSTNRERYFVEKLKPFYNKNKVFNNSKTNKGRKFSEEHKQKIREKSQLFKHKNIDVIIKQNKEGSCKFQVIDMNNKKSYLINSKIELINFLKIKNVHTYYNTIYKQYFIKVLKTQRKSVKLFINNEWVNFQSFEKCDKFLNKWRGYTSTHFLKNVSHLENYPVKFN